MDRFGGGAICGGLFSGPGAVAPGDEDDEEFVLGGVSVWLEEWRVLGSRKTYDHVAVGDVDEVL